MNGDGSQQRYVSTIRMVIRPGTGAESSSRRAERSPDHTDSAPAADPPVFMEPLEDCCVDERSDFCLRGVVTGSQPISVSWFHNGEVARFGNSSFDGREVRFVMRECLPEDAGAYSCSAENGWGKMSCSAAVVVRDYESIYSRQNSAAQTPTSALKNVTENGGTIIKTPQSPKSIRGCVGWSPVQSPATSPREIIPKKRANSGKGQLLRFENPPQRLEVKAGQTARLSCSFSCTPPVVSCWIRNKQQIVDNSEVWTENTERSSTLIIAETKPQHSGHYTVVVKDRNSSAQHTLTLSVIERPEPPASCPLVSVVSPSSLVLSWSGPCYDGGSAVLGYVVEVKKQGSVESEDWSLLTDQCRSTSYKVTCGLQALQEYCFRVRAYNMSGISEPSPASPTVKMEKKDKTQEEKEETDAAAYTCVTIDSSHKIKEHYDVQEKLGMGKFGMVYKLTHKKTGRVCAGKFYKGRRIKEREAARKEIELMNSLHHPKLVQCLAAYDHKPEMVMVMEFIAGGELFERIVDDSFEHTEPSSVRYVQQILEGISFMHQQRIVHLDLKPENIVCVDTTGTSIKIIDFGLASRLDDKPLMVMHGTPEFVAPEVINYEPVSTATDMWSIGVICYILLSGESPFQGNTEAETLALVTAAQWEFEPDSFDEITEDAKNFISSLLNKDPRRRMSCADALVHSWMAAFDSSDVTASKSLSKEKMKRFLARQKWKKAGKALLALKRMALLSKGDSCSSPTNPREHSPLSREAEDALQSLERKMQEPPTFTQSLRDKMVVKGSRVQLTCHLTGYPNPEVVWLCGDEPVEESPSVQIEYDEDGRCSLVLAQVCTGDANIYTCRATNEHGETFCSAKLTVE